MPPRTRHQKLLTQTTSVTSFPLELLEQTLDELLLSPDHQTALYRCARVGKGWVKPCLTRLYRRIEIKSPAQAKKLAIDPSGLDRYGTKEIRFVGCQESKSVTINQIYDACKGLEILGFQTCEGWGLPDFWFQHPCLQTIDTLMVYESWITTSGALNVPFKLRRFAFTPNERNERLVRAVVKASMVNSSSSITTVELHVGLNCEPETLSALNPVTSTLSTLVISDCCFHRFDNDRRLPLFTNLLSLLTSLSEFRISLSLHSGTPGQGWRTSLHSGVLTLLNAIRTPLNILDLYVLTKDFEEAFLEMLEGGLESVPSLKGLKGLKLPLPILKPAKGGRIIGSRWEQFVAVLRQKEIALGISKDGRGF